MDSGELFMFMTAIIFYFFLFGVCLIGTLAMIVTGHVVGAILTFLVGAAVLVGISEMICR